MKKKYDVFISYRRDVSQHDAKLLCDALSSRGYRVFYDSEFKGGTIFNKELYKIIGDCRDFILLLKPTTLDRCVNEDDWVRKELRHALDNGKHIIPLKSPDFEFPAELPADIDEVRHCHALDVNYTYFDALVTNISKTLISKP